MFEVSPRRVWQVLEPEEYLLSPIRSARRKKALRAAKEARNRMKPNVVNTTAQWQSRFEAHQAERAKEGLYIMPRDRRGEVWRG